MILEVKITFATRTMAHAFSAKLDLLGLNVRSVTLILKMRIVHNAVKAIMVKPVIKVT